MERRAWILLVIAPAPWACAGGEGTAQSRRGENPEASVPAAAQSASAVSPASVPDDRAGSFELRGIEYPFLTVQCDLTGQSTTGMLLRGSGTMPDGRRMTVEVERFSRGDMVHERATVYLGSIVDGDHWAAHRSQWPDGRWFVDPGGEEAEGPLVRVWGNELAVEASFQHETEGTRKSGVLRATCPA